MRVLFSERFAAPSRKRQIGFNASLANSLPIFSAICATLLYTPKNMMRPGASGKPGLMEAGGSILPSKPIFIA